MTVKTTYIRSSTLIGFKEIAEDAGVDLPTLFQSANFDSAGFQDVDRMIPFGALAALTETAAVKLNRPSIGLELALRLPDHFPNLGPIMLLTKYVETLGEFIAVAHKYWSYHTNAFVMQVLDDPASGLAVYRYHANTSTFPTRQVSEHVLAVACMVARQVTNNPGGNPTIVRFQHSRPRDATLHEQIFRCPIEFDADHTEYLFEPEMLQHKTDGRLRLLKPLVGLYIKHRASRTASYDGSHAATVSLTILSVMGSGCCNIDYVAEALGLNAKTLQRRLNAEGTSFSDILEQVRKNMACRLLTESNIPVERLAGLLDYSATPAFTLAFKRWTGQNPLQFRKSEQDQLAR